MGGSMFARKFVALALCIGALAPGAAQAQRPVQFASDVFVERFVPGSRGQVTRVLERADRLHSGDRVIFVVNWRSNDAQPFTFTNPLPGAIAFQRTAESSEDVSIDGGRTWGKLADLVVRDPDGSIRHANPEDVTTLRWRVPGHMAAAGTGQITYRGVVR